MVLCQARITGVVLPWVLLLLGQAQSFVLPLQHGAPQHGSMCMATRGSGESEVTWERRSVLLTGATTALTACCGIPLLFAPSAAVGKYINIEDAREAGERKRDELEKEKGPLIILEKGVRYREELVGKGPGFEKGDLIKIRYEVYKGNGDFMFAKGYGREFQNDVGETYDFVFGRPNSIPRGAEMGMEGMKVGGKRKILVPPSLGWSTSGGLPEPETFSGKRKLLNHQNENLQFEVELIRIKKRTGGGQAATPTASPTV